MNASQATRLFALVTLAAAAAATAPAAFAQDDGTQRTRADVKQETLAARQAGELMPAGEGMPSQPLAATSDKTRAERKAETLAARARDELVHAGIATYRASLSLQTAAKYSTSTRTRAERKAETLDAARHGQLMRAGEAG